MSRVLFDQSQISQANNKFQKPRSQSPSLQPQSQPQIQPQPRFQPRSQSPSLQQHGQSPSLQPQPQRGQSPSLQPQPQPQPQPQFQPRSQSPSQSAGFEPQVKATHKSNPDRQPIKAHHANSASGNSFLTNGLPTDRGFRSLLWFSWLGCLVSVVLLIFALVWVFTCEGKLFGAFSILGFISFLFMATISVVNLIILYRFPNKLFLHGVMALVTFFGFTILLGFGLVLGIVHPFAFNLESAIFKMDFKYYKERLKLDEEKKFKFMNDGAYWLAFCFALMSSLMIIAMFVFAVIVCFAYVRCHYFMALLCIVMPFLVGVVGIVNAIGMGSVSVMTHSNYKFIYRGQGINLLICGLIDFLLSFLILVIFFAATCKWYENTINPNDTYPGPGDVQFGEVIKLSEQETSLLARNTSATSLESIAAGKEDDANRDLNADTNIASYWTDGDEEKKTTKIRRRADALGNDYFNCKREMCVFLWINVAICTPLFFLILGSVIRPGTASHINNLPCGNQYLKFNPTFPNCDPKNDPDHHCSKSGRNFTKWETLSDHCSDWEESAREYGRVGGKCPSTSSSSSFSLSSFSSSTSSFAPLSVHDMRDLFNMDTILPVSAFISMSESVSVPKLSNQDNNQDNDEDNACDVVTSLIEWKNSIEKYGTLMGISAGISMMVPATPIVAIDFLIMIVIMIILSALMIWFGIVLTYYICYCVMHCCCQREVIDSTERGWRGQLITHYHIEDNSPDFNCCICCGCSGFWKVIRVTTIFVLNIIVTWCERDNLCPCCECECEFECID